jgi:hypothetical protein
MPRVVIPRTAAGLNGVELSTIAADDTDGMQFGNNGGQLLYVDNGSESSIDVTITMVTDRFGRSGTKVVAVPAGEQRYVGPFPIEPYNHDGAVHVDVSDETDVLVGVLSMP